MKLINRYLTFAICVLTILHFYLLNHFNLGFLLLSLSFIFLIYSSTLNPNLFKILISLLLFLGIWLKYFVRSILTPGLFNDPVGNFMYSPELVSEIFIYVAIIISFISYIFLFKFDIDKYIKKNTLKFPFDFKYQLILIVFIFILLVINFIYKIDFRGLNTHYVGIDIYIYKYLLHIFSPIFIFTFVDKLHHTSKFKFPFLCIFLFLYAISLNSRSFVFEGLLLLVFFIIQFRDLYNFKKYLIFFLLYISLAVTNFYYVNSTRYTHFLTSNNLHISTASSINEVKNYVEQTSKNVGYYSLFIDRWVGLEPIFAIYSYPNKSTKTFIDAILEKKNSDISFYDTFIIKDSTYLATNNKDIFYQNIPGVIGFSLYPSNMFITLIFIGLLFSFVCVLLGSITSGIFSTYIVSFMFAWRLSHFGYAPIYTFFYFILIFLTYLLINKSLIWKR